jgi:hypothetical protein
LHSLVMIARTAANLGLALVVPRRRTLAAAVAATAASSATTPAAAAAAAASALAPPALGAAAAALRALDAHGVAAWAAASVGVASRHVRVLLEQEIDGAALLSLTKGELLSIGLPHGPASAVARAVDAARAVELVVYPPPGKGAANNPVRMIMTPERFPMAFPAEAPLLLVRNGAELRKLFSLEEALAALEAAELADAFAAAADAAAGGAGSRVSRARLCSSRSANAELADVRGFMKSVSTALETATTRALARDAVLESALGGRLVAVNAGELVKLELRSARGRRPAVLLEADGLVAAPGAGALLLNSVKVTPADEDVDAVLQAASTLEHMLANLDAVSTLPPAAREQLRGLVRVVPFLSGSNFSARVEAVCRADGVGTSRPDGEGFAVTLPAL